MRSPTSPPGRPVPLEAALVARRYYVDDKQKSEIAAEFGISRFKVARLIDEARAAGIVRIHVEMPANLDTALGDAVAARYGLRRAIVVRVDSRRPELTLPLLGSAAADLLGSVVQAGDVLGISWGETLTHVVDAVHGVAPAQVVQLVGGVPTGRMAVSGVELVRRLSQRTGGPAFPLYAPLFVQSVQMAAALRRDPSLQEAIGRFDKLTVALVGIGSWTPPTSGMYAELSPAERKRFATRGVVADLCAVLLDASGHPVDDETMQRSVGIGHGELAAVPEVIAVAGGAQKAKAVRAAVRSRLVKTLVTDAACARALLS